MKYIVLLITLIIFNSCGLELTQPKKNPGCNITEDNDSYTVIQCGDQYTNITKGKSVQGPAGLPGSDGAPGVGSVGPKGSDGNSCEVSNTGLVTCGDTQYQIPDPVNGIDGSDGLSVVFSIVQSNSCANGGYTLLMAYDSSGNGVLDINDTGLQSADICNGLAGDIGSKGDKGDTGSSGLDGASPSLPVFTPTALITPCSDRVGITYKETFLKLVNGTLLASFSDDTNGKNTRFSILIPGNYQTTDGRPYCYFTVDSNNNIINEHY